MTFNFIDLRKLLGSDVEQPATCYWKYDPDNDIKSEALLLAPTLIGLITNFTCLI